MNHPDSYSASVSILLFRGKFFLLKDVMLIFVIFELVALMTKQARA